MLDKKYEEEILKFWQQKKIYEKSKKKNTHGKKFFLMDGPPYATGHIHMGTALNKILKDIAMRFKRLQGFDVFDKAGYDTHGVPIEFKIEKQIGSKSKKDIEKFGVKKFIGECKKFATKFISVMNKEFENLGVWMNFKEPYLTSENKYIKAIWDTFKKADEKGLLYLGKYPVHVCPRCETAVAYNEIEYSKQEDMSIYVKFPVKNTDKKFLIIWTTTPWTLPGNTGVMVNPDFEYSEIELSNGETWVIAKEKVQELMSAIKSGYTLKKTCKGKELAGLEYENSLSRNLNLKLKNAYHIVLSSRYVNLDEGTGLVHCAPGHGKEDYEVGKQNNLDMPSPVAINGLLTEEAGKYAGKKARLVDSEIIEDLEKDNFLVYKHRYVHDYPLCWRCNTPLLMISVPQWFFKISDIHSRLLKENDEVNWVPKYMGLRMKAWLEGISDWPISRDRYWGTPLPIWLCDKCGEKKVIGTVKELEKYYGKKIKDLHKPDIDIVEWKCKCGGKMRRVREILDVWFDSGVSSWAALGFPSSKGLFKKFWPADLNIEGKDQMRGWWNSQIILSEIKFWEKPFQNIVVHGMILDLGKIKMSKSLGNIVSPQDVIKKYGRDCLRYYFAKTSKGEDFAFDESEFKEIKKLFNILLNVNNFVSQFNNKNKRNFKIEDKWIISKFSNLIEQVTKDYNNFEFPNVIQKLEKFLLGDLSRTYIQIIRNRADETHDVLNEIRLGLLRLLAPVCPFITERLWQELKKNVIVKEESIHLCDWPKKDGEKINKKLEEEFETVLKIIEAGLAQRDIKKIGLKWPLAKAIIKVDKIISKELQEIITRQLNVKKVELKKGKKGEIIVELDTKLTPYLESEGYARELIRKIQAQRKKSGLQKQNKINLAVQVDENFMKVLEKQKQFIKNRTNSSEIIIKTDVKIKNFKNKAEFEVKEKKISIYFNKL